MPRPTTRADVCCPISLRLDPVAAMLNAELADDPVYDGIELQWFDDADHGTGMLAFLSRREDRTVDYYVTPGLRLDPRGYEIGGGTRSWNETRFDEAHLEVADDGVCARVRLTDVDGRLVEVDIDDRDGRPRRRARFLAPVSAGIDHPTSLLLVWMDAFDLVRATGARPPSVRIDGRTASTGRLPGARLHRRHLIKYAARLCSVELNRDGAPPTTAGGAGIAELTAEGSAIRRVGIAHGGHIARVGFEPPMPDLRAMSDEARAEGRWSVHVDDALLTGGGWAVTRTGDTATVTLDVRDRWRPRRLPWLMRLVTTVVPVFRRWPPTYAWAGTVALASGTVAGRWVRTGGQDGSAYRRATRSGRTAPPSPPTVP